MSLSPNRGGRVPTPTRFPARRGFTSIDPSPPGRAGATPAPRAGSGRILGDCSVDPMGRSFAATARGEFVASSCRRRRGPA